MDYSAIASKLNSAADDIESKVSVIKKSKSSLDSIWQGSAHDNLTGNLETSINNAKTEVSNLRKMAGSLNNLQAYKNKKEERERLSSQLSNTPSTEENASTISSLKSKISTLDNDLWLLKTRVEGSMNSFSGNSKQFEIITFDASDYKEMSASESKKTNSNSTSSSSNFVKAAYSNPNFNNLDAWVYKNPYAQAGYTGQCTWFSWGKFYETYGYSPGFTGNGCDCVDQLLAAHGDKFYKSDTPVAGSVFSILPRSGHPYGHTGMIIAVDGNKITVQDGNYNGTSDSFAVAQKDWGTYTIDLNEWKSRYSNGVVFANPI